MRSELIAKQGFIDKVVGHCYQTGTPTPTSSKYIYTLTGALTNDSINTENIIGYRQLIQVDGAARGQNFVPLLQHTAQATINGVQESLEFSPVFLDGDELEVNYRTMQARIKHKCRTVRILHDVNISGTYIGSIYSYKTHATRDIKFDKRGGVFYSNRLIGVDEQYYIQNATSLPTNNSFNFKYGRYVHARNSNGSEYYQFWVSQTTLGNTSNALNWLKTNPLYVVYELEQPFYSDWIPLENKLRNHDLSTCGNVIGNNMESYVVPGGIDYIFKSGSGSPEINDITFQQGKILMYNDNNGNPVYNHDGEITADNQYLTSGFIEGGKAFKINMKDGYKVTQVHLFNSSNQMIGYNFYYNRISTGIYRYGRHYEMELPKGYKIKITIIKNNTSSGASCHVPEENSNLNPSNINDYIDYIMVIHKNRLYRMAYETTAWKNGYIRAKQLCNLMFSTIMDKDYRRAAGYYDDYLKKDNVCMGVPYSESFSGFVGKQISIKTFISSLRNPISLFYTETPSWNTSRASVNSCSYISEYGLQYTIQQYDGTLYYGMVCACYADYIYGYVDSRTSKQYRGSTGTAIVSSPVPIINNWLRDVSTASTKYYIVKDGDNTNVSLQPVSGTYNDFNVRPLDVIAYNGHVVMIIDVLRSLIKTENTEPIQSVIQTSVPSGYTRDTLAGDIVLIQTIESVSPCVRTAYYTKDEFYQRFISPSLDTGTSYTIWRYYDITIPEPEECPYVAIEPEDVAQEYESNDEISTFAGDYATFAVNNPIHISVNDSAALYWSGIMVYKENVTDPIANIVFTRSNSADADNYYPVSICSDSINLVSGHNRTVQYRDRSTSFIGNVSSVLSQNWLDIDISYLFDTTQTTYYTGKFTCVAYIKSNQIITRQSTPTYFEVLNMDAKIIKSTSYTSSTGNNVYFTLMKKMVDYSTPHSLYKVGINGYGTTISSYPAITNESDFNNGRTKGSLTDEEISNIGITNSEEYSAVSSGQTWLKSCKGDYGYGIIKSDTVTVNTQNSIITSWSAGYYNINSNTLVTGSSYAQYGVYTFNATNTNTDTYVFHIMDGGDKPTYQATLAEYTDDSTIARCITLFSSASFTNKQKRKYLFYKPTNNQVTKIGISVPYNFSRGIFKLPSW